MPQVTFRLSKSEMRKLNKIAKLRQRSRSFIIREAIEAKIKTKVIE